MSKVNIFTLLTAMVLQLVVGYLWYSPHLFGDVMTTGGHSIDFLKLDIISMLLLVLGTYGLTSIMDTLEGLTHTKDMGGVLKLGVLVGVFGIGLPIIMLLNLLGFGKILLLVIFTHIVLITILTGVVVLKLKNLKT
jgi:hypothetical protein